MSLKDKTIWITGASSGIGEALAIVAAEAGATVILSARRRVELERVALRCNSTKVHIQPLDMADSASLLAAAEAVLDQFESIDILVQNAGISQRSKVFDTSMDVVRRVMDVNFFGVVELSKLLLPRFREQQAGQIVIVSSLVGKFGTPLRSSYAASKHALHGFFEALRAEEHENGLRVTMVCPGFIRTNVSVNAITADGQSHGEMDPAQDKGMDPLECAARIWAATEAKKEEVVIAGNKEGSAVLLKRFAPGVLSRLLRKVAVT